MVDDEIGILILINVDKEIIITLIMYEKDQNPDESFIGYEVIQIYSLIISDESFDYLNNGSN